MHKLTLILLLLLSCTCVFAQKSKTVAEEFNGTSLDGKMFDLNDLRGQVVALTFWSTRCPICSSEIPKLNQLVAANRGKNVIFLGLTVENEARVQPYLAKKQFDYTIIPNSFGTLLKYADKDKDGNINMPYPAYFLINQQGEIEYKANGWDKTEQLSSAINRLLGPTNIAKN